jgi:hypothetical protein
MTIEAFYYETDFEKVQSDAAFRQIPYELIAFSTKEIPLFTGMVVHSYSTHKIK